MNRNDPGPATQGHALKRYLVSQFGNPRGFVGAMVGHLMAIKNRRRIQWAVELLRVRPNDRVLEVGFGPGISLAQLARRAPQGVVTGVEHSPVMVAQARRRLGREIAAGRVEIQQGSVSALPFAGGVFDKALAVNTLLFWPQPIADLAEVKRVLAPGGSLLVVWQPHGASDAAAVERAAARVQEQMQAAGFVQISIAFKELPPVRCLAVLGRNP